MTIRVPEVESILRKIRYTALRSVQKGFTPEKSDPNLDQPQIQNKGFVLWPKKNNP